MQHSTSSDNCSSPAIILVTHGPCPPKNNLGRMALEQSVYKQFPEHRLTWSGTGQLRQVFSRAAHCGMSNLALLPLLLLRGEAFARLEALRAAAEDQHSGLHIQMAAPLLADPIDIIGLGEGLFREEVDTLAARAGVLLVGHGSGQHSGAVYQDLYRALQDRDPRFFVTVLQGAPQPDAVAEACKNRGIEKLSLAPLMVSAGAHWQRDVLGPAAHSILSRLAGWGFSVTVSSTTLLERPCARAIWLAHLSAAMGLSV